LSKLLKTFPRAKDYYSQSVQATRDEVLQAYSSKTCHCDLKVSSSNRQTRGCYTCSCGWSLQADVNASLNLFERQFSFSPVFGKRNLEELAEKVSPKRSSGVMATPVVLPLRLGRHMGLPRLLSLLNLGLLKCYFRDALEFIRGRKSPFILDYWRNENA
jgi:hypothetical protein